MDNNAKQVPQNDDFLCHGCKHDIPALADCRRRSLGDDGYMHFPVGYCYEAATESAT